MRRRKVSEISFISRGGIHDGYSGENFYGAINFFSVSQVP
jgi:hypothetical protein